LQRGQVSEIAGQKNRRRPTCRFQTRNQPFAGLGLQIEKSDARSISDESLDYGFPNSTCASGNDGHAILQTGISREWTRV
jgi:hypothetical protein